VSQKIFKAGSFLLRHFSVRLTKGVEPLNLFKLCVDKVYFILFKHQELMAKYDKHEI